MKNIYYTILLGILLPTKIALGTGNVGIQNPIRVGSIPELITAILGAIVAIGTPIAVLFLIYGGFKYVTAQGKPEKIKEANQYLMWTIIGIVILLGAELLATIIRNTITQLGTGVL